MEIYITDLAAYNQGHLIGAWISLPMDEEELQGKINAILEEGALVCNEYNHEEAFISDYECDYLSIEEYDSIEGLNATAELADGLNEYDLKAVRFLMDNNLVNDFKDALEKYDDVIIHENLSMEDIAYEYVNECYNLEEVPPIIANNIDYNSIAKDLEMDGNYYVVDSDIFEYVG